MVVIRKRTRENLIEYIKAVLGFPTVNVELTDQQINLCIDDAIDEIQPWYSGHKYLTTEAKMAIDLSEYQVSMVTDVFKVLKGGNTTGKDIQDDPFAAQLAISSGQMMPSGGISMSTYSGVLGNCKHHIVMQSAKMGRENLYSRLAFTMQQRLAGTFKDNISYKFIDDILYLDTGIPSSSIVTIEYLPKVMDVEDFVDDRYYKYLRDLSVAFCNVLLARVVGKYEVSSSPSTINHDRMYEDGKAEIERIREDLRDTVDAYYITD